MNCSKYLLTSNRGFLPALSITVVLRAVIGTWINMIVCHVNLLEELLVCQGKGGDET